MRAEEIELEIGHQSTATNIPPAITLRPFEPSETDFAAIMAIGSDERVNRWVQFDLLRSRDDAARFIENFILPHPWFRFICLSGSGNKPVGLIFLWPQDVGGGRRMVTIGYSVVPEMWGRGIATAAVRMVTEAAFKEWTGVERVQAGASVYNLASHRVLEKAGFQREALLRRYKMIKGLARDVVVYSFLSTDLRFSEDD